MKGKILKVLALAIDVGVPLAVTLTQFPLWISRSASATISGISILFILLSTIPFYRQIKQYFKSPSAWVMWGMLFLILFALSEIINEMVLICFFGFIANVIGAVIYKIGIKYDTPNEEKG